MSPDEQKRAAAAKALEQVQDGMKLGLGTGSTAAHFVDLLGDRVRGGLSVLCVPTSEATRAQAASLNIPLTTLDETPELDLTIDGADEVDPALRLIKGGGGALLREKIVASASARMTVIVDESKVVEILGAFPLPIEVNQFGYRASLDAIQKAARTCGCEGALRLRQTSQGQPFITDSGQYIVDCHFGKIDNPDKLAVGLSAIPGVMEHGLFIGIATECLVAGSGGVRSLTVS
jgi:ribose 5-phosphate isomerase A